MDHEHREDHPPHHININTAFTQSKTSNWNWREMGVEQQKTMREWEGLSYEPRLKEHVAWLRDGKIDMITAYKYSQSINTKEGKEFLAVNKEVLLGVNEERKKCGLYIRVNFLRHDLVGSKVHLLGRISRR